MRQTIIGQDFSCGNLRAPYVRSIVPWGVPFKSSGCVLSGSDDDGASVENDRDGWQDELWLWGYGDLTPQLFDIKAQVEKENSDVEIFIWGFVSAARGVGLEICDMSILCVRFTQERFVAVVVDAGLLAVLLEPGPLLPWV